MRPRRQPWGLAPALGGLGLLVAAPVLADPRVRVLTYDPSAVVEIEGAPRTATEILLPPGESVLHAAIGDAGAWDLAVQGGALYLRPKSAHARTNLVITSRRPDGTLRTYALALEPAPRRGGAGAPYVIRFLEPAPPKAQAADASLAARRLEAGVLAGPRNLDYEVQGSVDIQPWEISDNGRFTVMRFLAGQPMPAVYAVEPDGSERLAAFDVRGEFIVIPGAAKAWRLRRGALVLCIWNRAWTPGAPTASNTASDTASPEVARPLRPGPDGAAPAPEKPSPASASAVPGLLGQDARP